jgi:hypothetical protein
VSVNLSSCGVDFGNCLSLSTRGGFTGCCDGVDVIAVGRLMQPIVALFSGLARSSTTDSRPLLDEHDTLLPIAALFDAENSLSSLKQNNG